ncbi:DUF5050 domain-containing protein [Paenibacillus alkalitolerans]|uniref:DUF5050 domain-containing protein n=1 Tax=Paenibacillus alkalitolerans TaxID=2799335 RepID=UPI0018F5B079|nr:DUF5050 domain-containing protein [Paenibacillus alkalitolerans]
MRKLIVFLLLAICFVYAIPSTYAADVGKKPLNEVFDRMVIVPYDFQGKAFVNGQKSDVYEGYRMYDRNGRVLVPIRLMGYLAAQVGTNYWDVSWNQQKPDEVLLTSQALHKTIKFTVNSKTMLVNKQPVALDVPPQQINGRIVLPLRSAALALEKKIDWLDGLILIGDESVDLQHPQTLAIKDKIKKELTDTRKRIDYEKAANPIAKYGNSVYYVKSVYTDREVIEELYRKEDGKKEVKVQVSGKPLLHSAKVIGDELYYVSIVNNISELYAFSFAETKSRKICTITEWKPADGWLDDIMEIDNELYINLHTGDLTMGGETLYKVENGALKKVLSAKSLIKFAKDRDNIYFTDFRFMSGPANNLFLVDNTSGKDTMIGEDSFAYGVSRTFTENGGVSYGVSEALYIKDGYLYTLGYKESDPEDKSSVYKINLADRTQVKLTSPAKDFWMVDNQIYYIDSSSGYLHRVDLDGGNNQVLVERNVLHAQFHGGNVYYTANVSGTSSNLGQLYRYNIANKQEVKLGGNSINSFYVGEAGVYFISNGYEPGVFKADADGRIVSLMKDNVNNAVLTDAGMVYTLTYKEGVYSGK